MGGKSKDPNKAAMKQQKAQMKRLDKIDLPELQRLALESPELVGLLDAEQLDASSMEDISTDPRLQENQMAALESMKDRSEQGLTQADRFDMEEALGMAGAQEKAQRAQIEQEMAERGMGDSGQSLMMKLQNQQNSANQGRKQAMDMTRQSSSNRQNALSNLANMSGQMQNQDFNRQAQTASAKDAIAKANAMNRQSIAGQNLAARQAIANQQSATANQNQMYNKNIAQQQFQNELSKAGAQGGVSSNMSNIAANAPQSSGSTLGTLAGGAAGAYLGGAAGAGVGASMGNSAGSMLGLEDGGVVQQQAHAEVTGQIDEGRRQAEEEVRSEAKQRAQFKKKYMKKMHDELLGDDKKEPVKAADGRGFFQPNQAYVNKQRDEYINKKDLGAADLESGTVVDDTAAPADSGIDGKAVMAGLGSVMKTLEGNKPKARPALKLNDGSIQGPKNVMGTGMDQLQQFSNPFQAEDGALINQIASPSELPERGGSDFASPDDRNSAMIASLMAELDAMSPQETQVPMEQPMPKLADGGQYYSDGGGDIVDSGEESYADDRVDAKINDGEVIINVPQQQRLMDLIRGKIGPQELGTEDIVEGVPREYRDDMHQELDEESLMSLLEQLGKGK